LIVILILLVTPSIHGHEGYHGNLYGYVNPGMRVVYTFGEGITWGVEITLGIIYWDALIHSSVAIGWQKNPYYPQELHYIALQGGIYLFGASIGQTFYGDGKGREKGVRYTGYLGPLPILTEGVLGLAFATYEYYRFPALKKTYHSLSICGKTPVVLPELPVID
jgi:hypothetical protein